jgi:hypothetical protein
VCAFTWLKMRISRETSRTFSSEKKEQRDDIADVLDDGGNRDDESLFTNYHQH